MVIRRSAKPRGPSISVCPAHREEGRVGTDVLEISQVCRGHTADLDPQTPCPRPLPEAQVLLSPTNADTRARPPDYTP